ncbi:hypothetical protein [Tistrella sp.]|uniref:hypothetical protein n=1 Tax=Tistrella sp. TaxID=2024861 RepID=UPI000C8B2A25|nr:hypothetical protein [Tistrella sp.]MAD36220.1 hypothetical protein [Tistrella sp.]
MVEDDDADVLAFLEGQPPNATFSDMATACLDHFGPDRAWSADRIARVWHCRFPRTLGPKSKIHGNPAVKAFLDDRLGRFSLNQIARACRRHFGDKAPSVTSIHKYWVERRRAITSTLPASDPPD